MLSELDSEFTLIALPQDRHRPGRSIRGGAMLIASLLIAVAQNVAVGQPDTVALAKTRAAVPDEAALKAALGEIHNLFKNEFTKAKKPADKAELAEKLLTMAGESEVDAERYALLGEVRSLGVAAARPALVMQAVSAVAESFDVDRLATITTALEECGGKEWPMAARKELVAEVAPLVDEAMTAKKFKLARRLAAIGLTATRKTNQSAEGKQFAAQAKEAAALEKLVQEADAARKTLASAPDDAAAHATLGKYLCLSLGKWDKGLPHLAKGNDELLRAASERELTAPVAAAERVKAGDAWWIAAEKQSSGEKKQALGRAGYWYRLAIGELGGLNQIKVQKRLDELPPADADRESVAGGSARTGKAVETGPRGKSMFLSELAPRDVHLFPGVKPSDPVKFDGTPSPHGLQAHPDAQGFARLVYDLPPKFRALQGTVGIDDFMAGAGGSSQPIQFRIVGDGKELWKSRPINKVKDGETFSVDISGVKQLELYADCPSTWGAHSVWVEPEMLTTAPAKPGPAAKPGTTIKIGPNGPMVQQLPAKP